MEALIQLTEAPGCFESTVRYAFSPRETPGHRGRRVTVMAGAVRQYPDNIVAANIVTPDWPTFDRFLAMFDDGAIDVEPEGPWADEPDPDPIDFDDELRARYEVLLDNAPTMLISGPSDRTLRRRRQERRELAGALSRDGRATVESITRRVTESRAPNGARVMICIHCGDSFEAKRSDAEYCPAHKSKRSRSDRSAR